MKEIKLPPAYCSPICKNAMSEVCIEQCAFYRDGSHFRLKEDLDLVSMPRFPLDQIGNMTPAEMKKIFAVYIAKISDHLQGVVTHEPYKPTRRPTVNRSGSIPVSEIIHRSGLFDGGSKENPVCKNLPKTDSVESPSPE